RESLSIRPKDAELLYGLGVAMMEKGKLTEAADLARQAVAIAPAMAKAWLLLTQVKRQTERDPELASMEAEHAKAPQDSLARMQLSFGLGKAN
ncbi:tetratricopeptide repeat protein, partial [bacterium M00.F.Ca.ET.157.01.1.1]